MDPDEDHHSGLLQKADELFFGETPNYEEALNIYVELAAKHVPHAIHMLGLAHYEGLGIEPDIAKVKRASYLGIGVSHDCSSHGPPTESHGLRSLVLAWNRCK